MATQPGPPAPTRSTAGPHRRATTRKKIIIRIFFALRVGGIKATTNVYFSRVFAKPALRAFGKFTKIPVAFENFQIILEKNFEAV